MGRHRYRGDPYVSFTSLSSNDSLHQLIKGSLDLGGMKYSVDSYPETKYVTALALRKDEPGVSQTPSSIFAQMVPSQFIGTISHEIVLFPAPTKPTSTSASPKPVPRKTLKLLSPSLPSDQQTKTSTRMNDGGCDPVGRFFAGSMTLPEQKDGKKRGELWRWVLFIFPIYDLS